MNKCQKNQLQRLKMGLSIKAADILEKNEHLWKSFVAGRFKYGTLIELRDLSSPMLNLAELYVLTTKEHMVELSMVMSDSDHQEEGYISLVDGELQWAGSRGMKVEEFEIAYGGSLVNDDDVVFRFWWD